MTRLAVSMLLFTAAAAAQEAAEENPVRFTIGGRVLDESGAARPGLTVQAWDGERFLVAGVTGPKGRFLVAFREDVVSTREHPYGPLELRLVTTRWTMPRRAIRPGDRDLAITVRASVTRRALVKNADGDPFPGLVVRVRSGGRTVETTTVGDGSFRIHGLAPGAVVVQIIGDNFWIRKNKWADVITVPRVNHKAGR
ncbi:MAG: carboxypeptidase-like regulatory domain-containing protein, partial [Planctomycetota bacterium]|nr:carboxypeptidase-like regulatory domain-containing protein [Planctomycetota bacterium]